MNATDYNKLIKVAKEDNNLVGLILGGSRGKHAETQHSDYDVYLIVKDKSVGSYKKLFNLDAITLNELKNQTPMWDRYNFTHLEPVIDNSNGELGKVISQLGKLSEEEQKQIITENLDMYINYVYRSVKNYRDGRKLASQLDAVESISPMLTTLFALENRIRPYNKYLDWELLEYPLAKFSIDSNKFVTTIQNILNSGEIESQEKIYLAIKQLACSVGYKDIFDAWGNDLTAVGL